MPLPSDATAAKDLFRKSNGLFHLVHQFNVLPAAYAHDSWFESLVPPDFFQTLRKSRRGTARLSGILLRRHGLDNHVCYDFNNRWWRFSLLPTETIITLVLYCGLALLHRQIATLVSKDLLADIKTKIGTHAYSFAVQRAPLLIGRQQGTDLRWDGHSDIVGLARNYGAVYFLSHFRDAPQAIVGRLAFKFSRQQASETTDVFSGEYCWHFFKRILLHEIDPRWQPFFS